jgi:SAM-dependent methyltransferase
MAVTRAANAVRSTLELRLDEGLIASFRSPRFARGAPLSDRVGLKMPFEVSTSATEGLAAVLQRLYRNRFSDAELATMRKVWGVLVRDFFQSRIRRESTVLDIGAGPCLFINELQARRRIALDANPDVRDYAAVGVEAIVVSDLSLEEIVDGSIDYVFLSNFLEHLPDYFAVLDLLTRIHRKLRGGGSLLVLQPNYRLAASRYFDFIDHSMILTEASLQEALTAVGFEIKELKLRFLPFTSKSRLPQWPWLVAAYLRLPPVQWLFGRQTFVAAARV